MPPAQLDFVKGDGNALDPDAADQVDFLKLLNNSNSDVQREREAKKNGDLSGAKNYDEFLDQLEKQSAKLREPKNNLDKDDFLKLFVTQLQNQDPLNPENSTEMASKLAHFNSLEQMLNVNKTLDKMLSAQTQSQNVGMVNYIGKEITFDGGRIKFKNGEFNESTFTLKRPSSSTILEVRDEGGTLILSKPIGTLKDGEHTFKWDGLNNKGEKVADGTYTYSIVAKGINDEEIPVTIATKTKITGVDIKNKEGGLYTPLGVVSLDDIKSIGESGFDSGPAIEVKNEEPKVQNDVQSMDKVTTKEETPVSTKQQAG